METPLETSLERKACLRCGEPCLESETRCWACGTARFAADGAPLAGEPTLCLGEAGELTRAWDPPARQQRGVLVYAAMAAAAMVAVGVVGFAIGRAGSGRSEAAPLRATVSRPVALPPPPDQLQSAAGGLSAGGSAAQSAPPTGETTPSLPVVTIRSGPSRQAMTPTLQAPHSPTVPGLVPLGPAPAVQPPAGPPTAGTAGGPRTTQAEAPAPTRRHAVRAAGSVAPPMELPPAESPTLQASETTAVVNLRNNSARPVNIRVAGGGTTLTASVAARSTMPLAIPPGTYTLSAASQGLDVASSTVAVAPNRTYGIVVDRRQDGDRERLALIEPTLDLPGE